MSLALLCSGQGRQEAGMFALTAEEPAAAPLFAKAAALLGADPLLIAADAQARTANRAGQILCTLQAAAAFAVLAPWPSRLIVAGYSVGELAGWQLAGLVDGTTVLDLAAQRAALMDAASHPSDGLLFIRGLARDAVDRLCDAHSAAVAIVNPGDAVVVGGSGTDLDALEAEAERLGATRVQRLAVTVASHTPRMGPAAAAFRQVLDATAIKRPTAGRRLVAGIDAGFVIDPAEGRARLAAQIAAPVQWAACLEACVEAGATVFLELGPGHALSDMASVAYPACASRSLAEFRDLDGVRAWLARVSG